MIVTLQGGDGLGYGAKVKSNGAVATEVGNTVSVDVQNTVDTQVQNTVTTKPAALQAYRTAATVGTASAQLVAGRSGRRGFMIRNLDVANTIHVRFDGAASATTSDWPIPPGGELKETNLPYDGAIQAIASAANTNALVWEFA